MMRRRKRLRELKRAMKWDRNGRRHWFVESHIVVKIGYVFFVSHRGEVTARVDRLLDAFEHVSEREHVIRRDRARTAGTITGQWCVCNGTIHGAKDPGCKHEPKPPKYYHKLQHREVADKVERQFGEALRRLIEQGW